MVGMINTISDVFNERGSVVLKRLFWPSFEEPVVTRIFAPEHTKYKIDHIN